MEAVAVFTPLFLAFGLILTIGCANVGTLLLARGVAVSARAAFVGRSALRGAASSAAHDESGLLALAATGGGYLISRVALGGLALLLTVSGLFSVLSHLVAQHRGNLTCGSRSARRLGK